MTKAPQTPVTSPQLDDDFFLAAQDDYYAKHRLPEPTPAGAEDRTFCFRVELQHDLYPLKAMLDWAIEKWWSSPLCPMGDADVKLTLKPDTLSREELRWLFARVVDCHVAVETIELEATYTGERMFLEADELEAKCPSAFAVEQSLDGIHDYRQTIAAVVRRARDCEEELANALNSMDWKGNVSTPSLRARRKHASS